MKWSGPTQCKSARKTADLREIGQNLIDSAKRPADDPREARGPHRIRQPDERQTAVGHSRVAEGSRERPPRRSSLILRLGCSAAAVDARECRKHGRRAGDVAHLHARPAHRDELRDTATTRPRRTSLPSAPRAQTISSRAPLNAASPCSRRSRGSPRAPPPFAESRRGLRNPPRPGSGGMRYPLR